MGRAGSMLVLLGLAVGGPSLAQEPTPLSIEEAILVALDRSETVDQAEAGVDRARGQIMQAFSGFLPQINGTASYQRTFLSEYTAALSASQGSNGSSSTTSGGTSGTTGTGGRRGMMSSTTSGNAGSSGSSGSSGGSGSSGLPFGRENAWRFDLQLTQSVFAGGGNIAQVRIARAVRHANQISIDEARAQVVLATATAYDDVLLNQRLLEVAESGAAQAAKVVDEVQLRFDVGVAAELDVVQAKVALREQQVTLVKARQARDRALLQLRQLLDLPPGEPLALTTCLPTGPVTPLVADPNALAGLPSSPTRAPVRQAEDAVSQAEGSVGVARAQGLPRVSITADAYVAAYPSTPLPPLDGDQWRPNVTTSIVAQVPIFSGLRVRGALRIARADLASAEARREQTIEQAELEAADARNAFVAARETWEATTGAEEEAARAYEMAALRAHEGMLSQVDLADARLQFQRAAATRAQAAHDLALAEIKVLLLPNLPLQSVSPTAITTVGAISLGGAGATGVSAPTATTSTGTTGGVSAPTSTSTTGTSSSFPSTGLGPAVPGRTP